MDVVVVLALVGLGLAACALLMFVNSLHRRDHEHADRLALLPIDDDEGATDPRTTRAASRNQK